MKRVLFLILLFCICQSSKLLAVGFTYAYDIKLGKQPLLIKYDTHNQRLHVFCYGYDANFNGQYDQGDEKPSWWVLPVPGITIPFSTGTDSSFKMMDFEMGSFKFPLRAYFDITKLMDDGTLIISIHDTLKHFSLKNGNLLNENRGVYKTNDIDYKKNKIYLANAIDNRGEILILNGFSFLPEDTISLNFIPNGVLHFNLNNDQYIAALCEGTFGQTDSKIEFFKFNNEDWDSVRSINLGGSANSFILDSNRIYVAMNASHEVHVIDLNSLEIIKSLYTGTTEYNGPRELKVLNNNLYVSTYAGDIRRFNLENWALSSIYEASGKVEGFEFINENYLLAACPFKKDTYEVDSLITVFTTIYDVSEGTQDDNIIIKNNSIHFKDYSYFDNIEIYNALGELLYYNEQNVVMSNLNLDNFQSGLYFVRIKCGNSYLSKKFLINN